MLSGTVMLESVGGAMEGVVGAAAGAADVLVGTAETVSVTVDVAVTVTGCTGVLGAELPQPCENEGQCSYEGHQHPPVSTVGVGWNWSDRA
jgi:hypothetical protein